MQETYFTDFHIIVSRGAKTYGLSGQKATNSNILLDYL